MRPMPYVTWVQVFAPVSRLLVITPVTPSQGFTHPILAHLNHTNVPISFTLL